VPASSSATPILFFSGSMLRISTATAAPGGAAAFHPSRFPVGANADTCASASIPGSSSTKAPKSATRVTFPGSAWPTVYFPATVDQGSACSCFSPSEIFPSPSPRGEP